jgi:hypothetical protein
MPFIEEMVGKTFTSVVCDRTFDTITFIVNDHEQYQLNHNQDCCESVRIEDICGDLADLENSPIVQAEESSNSEERQQGNTIATDNSFTWTFYRIATVKGLVVIRWLGESNGYYGEQVDFCRL